MAPPVSSASVAPDSGERTASSRPWITSTGQRTRAASSRAVSSSNVPPCVAISVSGVVCRPQPMQSSICLVECGSVKICEKKKDRKPA